MEDQVQEPQLGCSGITEEGDRVKSGDVLQTPLFCASPGRREHPQVIRFNFDLLTTTNRSHVGSLEPAAFIPEDCDFVLY